MEFKLIRGEIKVGIDGIAINPDWGETEDYIFHHVGPAYYDIDPTNSERTIDVWKYTYYQHRVTGEIVQGPIVREDNHLFHAYL